MSNQNLKTAIRAHQERTGSNYTTARRAVLAGAPSADPAPPREPFLAAAASSTDPEVLQVLADRELLRRHFHFAAVDFALKVTGTDTGFCGSYDSMSPTPRVHITGIRADEKPGGEFGRWKKAPRDGYWAPAKNSLMEAEFAALNDVPGLPIPGLENLPPLLLGNRFVIPQVFTVDGVAWLRFPMDPVGHPHLRGTETIGTCWTPPERASRALAAWEDYLDGMEARTPRRLDTAERERVKVLLAEHRAREEARRQEFHDFWAKRTTRAS